MVEEEEHRVLDEEPRAEQGQAAELPVEPVVVRVEREVIQIEIPIERGERVIKIKV